MKIVVTGALGLLGQEVVRVFRAAAHEVVAAGSDRMDVTDPQQTMGLILAEGPDVVVHCAAYTNVDGCERDPDRAYRVNALGAASVASACEAAGAWLVAISTDFVFDGIKGAPYTEFDTPRPLGVYGASKLAGEALVKAACPRHQIVRTSWLFGVGGRCFPRSIIDAANERKPLRVVSDQRGSPTYAADLAEALLLLSRLAVAGTYHVANTGECSWWDFARIVLDGAGLASVNVEPISSAQWPSPTTRPACSSLRGYAWALLGLPPLRPWQDAVVAFLEQTAGARAS